MAEAAEGRGSFTAVPIPVDAMTLADTTEVLTVAEAEEMAVVAEVAGEIELSGYVLPLPQRPST